MSDLRERFKAEKEQLNSVELPSGHKERFFQKLDKSERSSKTILWKIAATLLLLLASSAIYWLNKPTADETVALAESSPIEPDSSQSNDIPLQEASFYYQQTIDQQFASLEQFYEDKDSKELIEQTKLLIKDLQDEYKKLEKELDRTGEERIVIAMIGNYQKRIEILKDLIEKLNYIKQIKEEQNENSNQNA